MDYSTSEAKYAFWRTDKEKEDGYSPELVSFDTQKLIDAGQSDIETLDFQPIEGIDTAIKAIRRNLERIPDGNFLGKRVGAEYQWLSFKQVVETTENLSFGCHALNLVPETDGEGDGKKWRIMGIQSKNRVEWSLLNIAGMVNGVTTVPLYDTLGVEASRFIIQQTEMTTIAVPADLAKKICSLKKDDMEMEEANQQLQKLANIIVFEEEVLGNEELLAEIAGAGLQLYTLDQVEAKGKEVKEAGGGTITDPVADDVFMLSYTSGTTGVPKGVKLTHKMLINDAYAIMARIVGDKLEPFTENDTYISYLPAAHSFEQIMQGMTYIYGLQCGFYGGDVTKLTEDLQVLKPTVMPSVPRLYNRIYGLLQAKFKSGSPEENAFVQKAIDTKLQALREGKGFVDEQLDSQVFSKVRPLLGGKIRVLVTGAAPLAPEIIDFFKVVFSCEFCEGYGMTENCGGACAATAGDPVSGHVGGPLQHIKVKLRDIPEMNYLHTNECPEGEILFYGGSVMPGYFKNPEKTAEFIDEKGWLQSGDVGRVFPNGSIKVIDRSKNIFKLSQGEYIAPEKVEQVYIQSPFIAALWVYGDSLRDYPIAFIVVEPMAMKKVFGGGAEDFQLTDELLNDANVKQAILYNMIELADANKFNTLEKPKNICLLAKPFNEINADILTPTFKMKRNVAKEFFKDQISAIYAEPPMSITKQ